MMELLVKKLVNNFGIEDSTPWPGNSSNMNPVKYSWAILKQRVNLSIRVSFTTIGAQITSAQIKIQFGYVFENYIFGVSIF